MLSEFSFCLLHYLGFPSLRYRNPLVTPRNPQEEFHSIEIKTEKVEMPTSTTKFGRFEYMGPSYLLLLKAFSKEWSHI